MTTRRTVAPLLLAAILAGCTASKVDPDARIDLRGSVSRQDGAAVAGARVALTRQPDLGEVLGTLFSLGLACLDDRLPSACAGARVTTTGPDGAFRFEMTGRDTHGTGRTASTLDVTTRLPRDASAMEGPAVTMSFLVQTEVVTLPLRAWEPTIRATGDGRHVRLRWSPAPARVVPDEIGTARLRTSVRFERGDELVWAFNDVVENEALDARLLEDAEGAMAVHASVHGVEVPDAAGSRVGLSLRSALLPYTTPGLVPVSRGKPCMVDAEDGRPVAQASCRLTDGRFTEAFAPRTVPVCDPDPARCPEPPHRNAVVDLGRTRSVGMVVIRGCDGPCTIETSRDGRAWRLVASGGAGPDENVALRLAQPVRARYVRVAAQGGVEGMKELSVWESRAPRRGAARSIITSPPPLPATTERGSANDRSTPIIGALLLLVAVGLLGGGMLRLRARGRL